MNESELPSDSDVSDEDYRPSGEESGAVSEEESGPDDDAINDDCDNVIDKELPGKINSKHRTKKKNRTKKCVKKKSMKRKVSDEESTTSDADEKEKILTCEEQTKKSNSLWADFLKDCGPPKKKPSLDSSYSNSDKVIGNESSLSSDQKLTANEKENKSTVAQIFEFAGEKITVEKEVPSNSIAASNSMTSPGPVSGFTRGGRGGRGGRGNGSSALTSFLGQLGKKGKLSTLEKSKLDWDQFKKNEGIGEDLQKHNKGKDGFLERQDFLQRTDLRRFEIEKSFRQKRSNR